VSGEGGEVRFVRRRSGVYVSRIFRAGMHG